MASKILITGATGFVGRVVLERMIRDSLEVRVATRHSGLTWPVGVEAVQIVDGGQEVDWQTAVRDINTVVHCAARVHIMKDAAADPLAAFRAVNLDATLGLAKAARRAGARRFVFISSVKVNGESTLPGHPFTADQSAKPQDPYGISKYEAEQALRDLANSGLEVVIIRPPLVYGPGVKANFRSMMQWLRRGLPLPFGAIENRRSLIAVDNLADLIVRCVHHPAAANETFLASDNEDLSTPQLLRRLALALGTQAHLFSVRSSWIERVATMAGFGGAVQRLCGTLQVDISKTRSLLGWSPVVNVDEGLRRAAEDLISAPGER